jgi:O-antigen/teichoic acid export membrane protein
MCLTQIWCSATRTERREAGGTQNKFMNDTVRQFAFLIAMVLARILAMLVAFKYLSIHFGPTGFGKLSQVMAIGALFSTFAGGGLFNGLVREVAASKTANDRAGWLKAGLVISIASIVVLGTIAVGLYFFGANTFLDDASLAWVFALIGLAQIGTAVGNTSMAYLSGLNAVKFYSLSGILGSLFSVIIVIGASHAFGFSGAIAGSAVFALAPSLFALAFLWFKMPEQLFALRKVKVEKSKVTILGSYSIAMIVAASVVPAVLVYMRSSLGQSYGWNVVGEWQSVARIGDAYIQVFGVLFANFLLPRLSGATRLQQSGEMKKFVAATLALFFAGAAVFYVFAPFVLQTVYSSDFKNATIYVLPQLAADLMKIVASFFVFRFMADGRPNIQAVGEVLQACAMVLAFKLLMPYFQGTSAVWSYVAGATCVASFLVVLTLLERKKERKV